MELEQEHSAPANDKIPSAQDQMVAMWKSWIDTNTNSVGHPSPGILAVAMLFVQKMADYQGRQGGQRQSSSLLDCCKAARVQQCTTPNAYISYNSGL